MPPGTRTEPGHVALDQYCAGLLYKVWENVCILTIRFGTKLRKKGGA
jgi:hypothetical protein